MAEFNMILPKTVDKDLQMTRIGNVYSLNIESHISPLMMRQGNSMVISVADSTPLALTRKKMVYDSGVIIPIRVIEKNSGGTEEPAKKEVREWDMVLTFGGGAEAPRRRPLDIAWTKKQF